MTLTQIQYFLEVCQTMNFTKAAQNLYVAQPSLSRQIQLLETELGVQLIARNNRNVVLTDAGKVFKDEFKKIAEDIEIAIHKTKEAATLKKEIHIGLFQGVRPQMIHELMEKISVFFDGYKVHVNCYSSYNLKKALEVGNIDLVIGVKGFDVCLENIETCYLGEKRAYLIFSPKLFSGEGPKSIEDFNGKKFICVHDEMGDKLVNIQCEIVKKLNIFPSEKLTVSNVVTCLLYGESQTGFSVYMNGKQEGLERYPVPDWAGGFNLFAVWKKDVKLPMRRFFEEFYGFST